MESLLVEAGFIHFHISPCPGRTAVLDGVLNLGDMEIADEVEVPVHPFHRLMVDVCNQVDDAQGNSCKTKKKSGSLNLKTVAFGTSHHCEYGMKMKR